MDSLDESPLPQNLGSPTDGEVSDAIFLRQIALSGQARTGLQLSGSDPGLDVVGHSNIDELGSLRGEVGYLTTVTHKGNVGRYRATRISRELCIALHGLVGFVTDEPPAAARTTPGYGHQPLRS